MTCADRSDLAVLRLRLEQRINGLLGVFDYEPFFFRSSLEETLLSWGGLFRHRVLSSFRVLIGIPPAGLEPALPEMGSRLQSGSVYQFRHGGIKALNVG